MITADDAQFAILAFSSLFSVINPISAAPIFVAMTGGYSQLARRRAALRASGAAAAVLAFFALAGGAIFTFFGITVPAFQIAGGLLFTLMGIRTLQTGREEVSEDTESHPDPSIVPLGIPLIAGPGAISTVMVLVGQAGQASHRLALAGAISANVLLTAAILFVAPAIVVWLGLTGQRIVSKIMGLLTVVIGVQFILNGTSTVFLGLLEKSRSAG
jgi:multiple antibiotic resistance protein